jgi:hypothetical protein
MSIKVLSHIWQTSQATGSKLLVLLAMADFADDHGGNIYPSMQTLAAKARLSSDQTRRVVHELAAEGYIELVSMGGWRNGRNWANEYRILLDRPDDLPEGGTCNLQGGSADARGGTSADASTVLAPVQVQPSLQPSYQPSEAATATERETAAVWQAWTDNMPGTITPIITDAVHELLREYSAREVIRAIGIAVERNKRSLGYIRGCLQKGVDVAPVNGAKPKSEHYITDPVTGEQRTVYA